MSLGYYMALWQITMIDVTLLTKDISSDIYYSQVVMLITQMFTTNVLTKRREAQAYIAYNKIIIIK